MKRIRVIHGVHTGQIGRVIGPDYRPRGTDQVWTPVQFDGEERPVFVERGELEPVGREHCNGRAEVAIHGGST